MKDYKGPVWLAVLLFVVIYTAGWYVNRDIVDKTDFNDVVHQNVQEDQIVHMNSFEKYGFVIFMSNGNLQQGLLERFNKHWNYRGSALLEDGGWGINTGQDGWLYMGHVMDKNVEEIMVGDKLANLFNHQKSVTYWFYREPNGYNYPIKAVKEDGSTYWIKEK